MSSRDVDLDAARIKHRDLHGLCFQTVNQRTPQSFNLTSTHPNRLQVHKAQQAWAREVSRDGPCKVLEEAFLRLARVALWVEVPGVDDVAHAVLGRVDPGAAARRASAEAEDDGHLHVVRRGFL